MNKKKKLVIFDLDGTLLNTIADLAVGTNYALNQLGYSTHPTEAYKLMVGGGINKLFERALPSEARNKAGIMRMREEFIPFYDLHNADLSTPYEGITTLLGQLTEANIKLAVASNKYQSATLKLVKHFFPHIPFCAIYGQREGIAVKPDPTIVHDILKTTEVSATDTLYVGDSGVDMQTALNAGVTACGVTWGFRSRSELESLHPAHIVDFPEQILHICIE